MNPTTKRLEIETTANQDPLLSLLPIIGVDIWEHAFYLQYLNVKPDVCFRTLSFQYIRVGTNERLSIFLQYLKAIWHVINFDEAAKRYDAAVTQGIDAAKL